MASDRARAWPIVAALVALSPTAAHAQSAADRETARSLMDEGHARRERGDHKGALERFQAADALMHVPTTSLEVARSMAALGMLLEARDALVRIAQTPARKDEPAAFSAARRDADALSEDLGKRIPSIKISLDGIGDGRGVVVTIDGESIPPASLIAPRKANPGTHTVVVRSGGADKRETVVLHERETREITVDLRPAPAAPPPPSPQPPPPRASAAGEPAAALPSSTRTVIVVGGFALAIVGAGVGTVTGILSLNKIDELKSRCPDNQCAPDAHGTLVNARALGNVSTVSFVAAGVGAAVGLVGLFWPKDRDRASASARPWIGAGSAGLAGDF